MLWFYMVAAQGVMLPIAISVGRSADRLGRRPMRCKLGQGAVATAQGIAASISALAAGEVTDHFGCSASFLFLAAAAAIVWAVFALLMPETRDAKAIGAERVGAAPGWAPGQ